MNIFLLDYDLTKCARYHADKHVVKMITEHNQILCSVYYSNELNVFSNKKLKNDSALLEQRNIIFENFPRKHENGDINPYGLGYIHHPCTQWAANSYQNWSWLVSLNTELCQEYTYRYGKVHKGEHITKWCSANMPTFNKTELTEFPQAMDDEYKISDDPSFNYQVYYTFAKSHLHSWKNRETPEFIEKLKNDNEVLEKINLL